MRRTGSLLALVAILLIPGSSSAKVDPISCPGVSGTAVIHGLVQNVEGAKLGGMLVELYTTNRNTPTSDSDTTRASGSMQGQYTICAGRNSGSYYDTFDVHVRDAGSAPLYATAAQPYSTYGNPAGDADFTPASGHPLLYMADLTVSPSAFTTATASRAVTWTVRAKAPSDTSFFVTPGHRTTAPFEFSMAFAGTEGGGPAAGGWNLWRYNDTVAQGSAAKQYWSSMRSLRSGMEVAQRDNQPWVIDNTAVAFGPANATVCGSGVFANAFSPGGIGTTNHRPLVTLGVCDPPSATGSLTGPDPYSLRGWTCPAPNTILTSCTEIHPVLDALTIRWTPSDPLPDGVVYVVFQIADLAGNVSQSNYERLQIGNTTGQVPWFTALSPGNLGSGSTGGVVVGSSLTSPSSLPTIGFRVLDGDGPVDIVPGSLDVRVYFLDNNQSLPTLVYRYDITMAKDGYDLASKRGGGDFDLSGGLFKATGYALQEKPPGRYVVTASVTDRGGNNASVTWHFMLALAI